MANAMRLLILLCALAKTPIAASHRGGVSSARTLDREPLASCHDPRIGEIFLTKWLHKSNVSKIFTRCVNAASMTTMKHRRTFTAPEGPLPTGNEGSHTRHAAERELSGFDPWRWRSSVRLVRGGSMPKKMTDQDLFAREQQTVRNVLLYYPNLIGKVRYAVSVWSTRTASSTWRIQKVWTTKTSVARPVLISYSRVTCSPSHYCCEYDTPVLTTAVVASPRVHIPDMTHALTCTLER